MQQIFCTIGIYAVFRKTNICSSQKSYETSPLGQAPNPKPYIIEFKILKEFIKLYFSLSSTFVANV